MKTLELKLKKDVFIVDIPIDAKNIYLSGDSVVFNTNKSCIIKSLNGNYKFLCKGSELTEEIASELCHNIGNSLTIIGNAYLDDVNDLYFWEYAIDAFITSLESKGFYWLENPIKRIELKEWKGTDYTFGKYMIEFNKAEEKTFRNPLIFVKK